MAQTNQPPTADAGGPYVTAEGQTLALSAAASHDPDAGDTLTYSWDVNGDGTFGDASGVSPTLTWAQLIALGLSDGPHANDIRVRVDDGNGPAVDSSPTGLTLDNAPPTAGISGPAYSPLPGESLSFTLTADDPSPDDQAAGFTFRLDWDGDTVVDETISGPSGMVVNHTYATPGTYNAGVTAEDKDQGVSDPASTPVHVLAPSSIVGLAYVDFNNDGQVDFGENALSGVTVSLSGFDDLGQPVNRSVQTDANGIYAFGDLRPSDAAGYSIVETQPAGYPDGRDTIGKIGGIDTGSAAVNDAFSGIVISLEGTSAENYNFGERPATTGSVGAGQTATIGFWQNKKGQQLITSLNGNPSTSQLGQWLYATFPNFVPTWVSITNNAGVASWYSNLFNRTAQTSPGGPPKLDAQVVATAFAVYVTNETLAGNTAAAYGFQVTATGLGTRTFNVGNNGAAFGVANNSSLSVMDLLLAVNDRSFQGQMFDANHDGQVDSSEVALRRMANSVFSAINESGDI